MAAMIVAFLLTFSVHEFGDQVRLVVASLSTIDEARALEE